MRIYRFDKTTGQIFEGGYFQPLYDPSTEGLFELTQDDLPHLDFRLQRIQNGILRAATQQEIDDYDSTKADLTAKQDIDQNRGLKAAVITSLWGRLNRQPTPAEINAERTRFINVYKQLG